MLLKKKKGGNDPVGTRVVHGGAEMSGTEGVTQLHSDVDDITSALQTLLEKREMYASMLAKLDTEEHGVVRRLQDSRARFRGLAALGVAPAADTATTPAPEHASTPRARALGTITNDAAWDHLVERCPALRAAPPVVGAARRQLAGPATEDVCTLGSAVAARTISTYPMNADRTKRVCLFLFFPPHPPILALLQRPTRDVCVCV